MAKKRLRTRGALMEAWGWVLAGGAPREGQGVSEEGAGCTEERSLQELF